MRTFAVSVLLLLVFAAPGWAEEEAPDPSAAALAEMILDGGAAEHDLVTAWLVGASRDELRAVFSELRALRAQRSEHAERPDRAPGSETAAGGTMVTIEARVIDVPLAAVSDLLGAHRPTADQTVRMLTEAEARALLAALPDRKGARVVTAPRITMHNRQTGNVSVQNQVSYVQDYDIERSGDLVAVDPIIGVLQEGVVLDLRPTVSADGTSVAVSFQGTFAALVRPIATKTLKLGEGIAPVTIQLPELNVARVSATAHVPVGGWVLIGGGVEFQPEEGDRVERVTLLRVETADLETPSAKPAPAPEERRPK
ncbi:MAG: hypothetical protein O2894_02440 [Planctomycetota bacterium]|nr:hypothetical protein [Planctomycetota bacterium]